MGALFLGLVKLMPIGLNRQLARGQTKVQKIRLYWILRHPVCSKSAELLPEHLPKGRLAKRPLLLQEIPERSGGILHLMVQFSRQVDQEGTAEGGQEIVCRRGTDPDRLL